jgi:ring-1,2-phenylacetyl-CoA epoxidase subunit PaaE
MEFYLCGPDGFMSTVRSALLSSGVPKDSLREENFGAAIHQKKVSLNDSWTYIGEKSEASDTPEKIIATLHGETLECDAKENQSILETLIEAGANPPYSCMDGACMACLAKVDKGLIYQEDPGILSDDNIENKEALTCQARPASRVVHVNYDSI